jgi:6-phosphogluconolactonase
VLELFIIRKMNKKVIHRFNSEKFSKKVTLVLTEKISEQLKSTREIINIALSGGSTPIPILKELKNATLDWNRINFFLVDERCVLEEDVLCNYKNIKDVFFKHIPSNSFSMTKNGVDFIKSSENYQILLDEILPKSSSGIPEFDLVILGMGDDGHTASLFPKTEALSEQINFVVLNEVPQLETQRITLTYPVILAAKQILVLCTGKKKEEIINEIYTNKGGSYPITKIAKEHPNFKWLTA